MRKFNILRRAALSAISMAAVSSICTKASAAPILAGDFAGFAPAAGLNPLVTATPVTVPLVTPFVGAGPGGISGTITSQVFTADPANPFGPTDLTFVFQVHSTGSPIDRFTSNDFTSFNTDVSYALSNGADVVPTNVDRPTAATIGWTMGPFVLTGQETALLIVRTDATQDTVSTGSVIDGEVASGAVYGPFNSALSPEPASIAFLAGFGMLSRRRRQK
jgi:hypothetical protein